MKRVSTLSKLLLMGLLCAVFSLTISADTISDYAISISLNSGPLAGQTGSGTMAIDKALAQTGRGFTFVVAGEGLLSLQMTLLGTTLVSTDAVNYPVLPLIFLDSTTLAPIGIWSAWGSTTDSSAPTFIFLSFGVME